MGRILGVRFLSRCCSAFNTVEPTAPPAAKNCTSSAKTEMSANKRVAIIFYSTYGHTLQMAKKVKEGVDAVDGV